jgi:biotin carboxyl carrier protein
MKAIQKGGSWRVGKLWVTPLPDGTWAVTDAGGGRTVVAPAGAVEELHGPVKSPMAGVVTAVAVADGVEVQPGHELLVVEAMKMRFAVPAKAAGTVTGLAVQPGDRVTAGQVLLALRPL